ncbi:MAG TPA: metallophosphoesterase [bacterium]|nr:metallophosphoesterase [bacterium]
MRLLVVADLHAVLEPDYECSCHFRKTHLSLEFLQRVIFRAREKTPDALLILGDFIDQPCLKTAKADFEKIVTLLRKTSWPTVIVRGNHDLPEEVFLAIAGDLARPKEVSGYLLYPFHDRYHADETCRRPEKALKVFQQVCLSKPSRPVIALQHNLVYPPLDVGYPMNFENGEEILETYLGLPVCLSLSGHCHTGVPLQFYRGLPFLTAPALCEAPFPYLLVEVGERIEVKQETLVASQALPDVHCHTEFAYCATTVKGELAVDRSRLFNCSRLVLTEHSTQLYVTPEEFSQAIFMKKPGLIEKSREGKTDRMPNFLTAMKRWRSDSVLLGAEVELDCDRKITLLPEDRKNFDLLLGAVHWLPEEAVSEGGKRLEQTFLSACEILCTSGIAVLAHPFRIFRRYKLPVPTHLFSVLARLLKETGVAAEINFHTNQPDPEFFRICLEKGVKLATGTDAHCLEEAGDLQRHLDFLTNKLEIADPVAVIFQPGRSPSP